MADTSITNTDMVSSAAICVPVGSSAEDALQGGRLRSTVATVDTSVDRVMHPLRVPGAVRGVEIFSHLGDGGAVWLVTLALLAPKNPRASLRAALILMAGTVVVNGPVKKLTKRPRPEPLDPAAFRPGGTSFPSGHAFSSWLVASMLPSPATRYPAAAVASAIASSRVFLRYHHATDVIAGAALGLAVGSLLRRVVRWY